MRSLKISPQFAFWMILLGICVFTSAQTNPDPLPIVMQTVVLPKVLPLALADVEGLTTAYCALLGDKCSHVMLLSQSQMATTPVSLNSAAFQSVSEFMAPEEFTDTFKRRANAILTNAENQLRSQQLLYAQLPTSVTGRAILRTYNDSLPRPTARLADSRLQTFYESLRASEVSALSEDDMQAVDYEHNQGVTPKTVLVILGTQVSAVIGIVPSATSTPTEIVSILPDLENGLVKAITQVLGISTVTAFTTPVEDEYPGSCMNGVLDVDDETDIDCGRADVTSKCGPCLGGKNCLSDSDCWSLNCTTLVCAAPRSSSAYSVLAWGGGTALITTVLMISASVIAQLVF